MADATDSKSVAPRGVRVQIPPPVPQSSYAVEQPELFQSQPVTSETAEARRLMLSGGGIFTTLSSPS